MRIVFPENLYIKKNTSGGGFNEFLIEINEVFVV